MAVPIKQGRFLTQVCLISMLSLHFAQGFASSSYERVALVTGANKGIGKEIVRLLGKDIEDGNSWIILLGSRDEERGNEAVQELSESLKGKKSGSRIILCPLDLTDDTSIVSARDMVEKHGGGKLDVLVNNAAICFNDPTLYGAVSYTPFEKQAGITVNTNFFGTLKVTRTMLPLLQQSKSPRIINIASSAGRLAILKSDELIKEFTSSKLQMEKLESLLRQFVTDVESQIHASKGWPNTWDEQIGDYCHDQNLCAGLS